MTPQWNPTHRKVRDEWGTRPEQWKWSSFRAYFCGETGAVRVKSQEWALEIKRCPVQSFAGIESPLIRKVRE